MAQKNN